MLWCVCVCVLKVEYYLLGAQHKCTCAHTSRKNPRKLSLWDVLLKGQDVNHALSSGKLGICDD